MNANILILIKLKVDTVKSHRVCRGRTPSWHTVTLFSGFDARVAKELKERAPSSMESVIKVVASAVGRYSAWAGGSLLASLPTFQQSWITRAACTTVRQGGAGRGPSDVHAVEVVRGLDNTFSFTRVCMCVFMCRCKVNCIAGPTFGDARAHGRRSSKL